MNYYILAKIAQSFAEVQVRSQILPEPKERSITL